MSFAQTFVRLGLSDYYTQYFEALRFHKKTNDESIEWDKVVDTYAGYGYALRNRQLYDKADALEILVDSVQETTEHAQPPTYTELPRILYFLAKLADPNPTDNTLPTLSSKGEKLLAKKEFQLRPQPSTEEFFGTRISNYENAQRINMSSAHGYFQYPEELFQEEPKQTLPEDLIPADPSRSECNEFFRYGELTEPDVARPTFFGGLKPLSERKMDAFGGFSLDFEIPELPEVPHKRFDLAPEEASRPADDPPSSVRHQPREQSPPPLCVFPRNLANLQDDTRTVDSWEPSTASHSPYISESDTRTFEAVYQKYFRGGNWEKTQCVVIKTSTFMEALLNLANGIVSRLFVYDQECRVFEFRVPHFRVQGLGATSLQRILRHFMSFGTRLRRLEHVVNTILSSPSTFGLTGVAFAHSLSSFLLSIREVIGTYEREEKIRDEQAILRLYYFTQDLSGVLQWLANLCYCDLQDDLQSDTLTERQYEEWVASGFYIPHGSHLLSHIYEKAYELDSSTGTLLRPLALSILSESSAPYFQLIDKWLRVDIFKSSQENPRTSWDNLLTQTNWDVVDPYHEFFIVNTDLKQSFLERNGDGYWEDGYQISDASTPPSFVSKTLAREVLEAGKSLRLLNECRKKHPLYTDSGEYHEEGLEEFSHCSISLRWLFKIKEIEEHQKLLMEHKRVMVSLIAQREIERKLLLQKEIDQSREIRIQKKQKAETAMKAMREERARRLKIIADKKEAYRKSIMDFLAEQQQYADSQTHKRSAAHNHPSPSKETLRSEVNQSTGTPDLPENEEVGGMVDHISTLSVSELHERKEELSEASDSDGATARDEPLSLKSSGRESAVSLEKGPCSRGSFQLTSEDLSQQNGPTAFGSFRPGLLTQKDGAFGKLLQNLAQHNDEDPTEDYIPPLSIINQLTVVHTLKRHCRLINSSVLSFFFHEMNLTGHLNVLRQYLLLGNGFYVNGIVQALFDDDANLDEFTDEQQLDDRAKMSAIGFNKHFGWPLSGRKLNSALKAALLETISDDLPLEFMDSTRVNEIKDLDERLEFLTNFTGFDTSQIEAEGIEALDFIRVKYHAPHPLDVIITPTSITKYNQVFNFLLRILRVDTVSRHIFRQTRLQHEEPGSTQILWKFRFEIHQFINAVRGYVFDYAVGVTWEHFSDVIGKIVEENDFQKQYERYIHDNEDDTETLHILDLRSLMEYHDMVLDRILHRCFLLPNQAFVMNVITEIFELILELAQYLQDPSAISALYEEFKGSREKLFAGLVRLEYAHPRSGGQPTSAAISSHEYVDRKDGVTYIQEFLLRLDFSKRFMRE
ncbi:hypothetical protein K493DRAFT_411002 [Basidiobolus meristosporus CBS 931.73]|uniref:Gamma tubulin complex component C-terminal domain-containing protein n=1 Tax=Basidiobolus meristosporus CBS 931.73 TaxID=1314790 RepID=A0A1Y1XRS3_9FUNG|nr:hypothetical protein K493DRAFT_411002 [Basidiobolus meristosporus CBS 931.73]|eukprot:ORX88461.1 hypothetical protein K493DRAFT_411002 [Basidiobolus meristosporus CBS 931.73]